MYLLTYSEFYITNVCNLNCTNCNRFNNYTFKGHYNFSDYEHDYIKWSKLINIETIGILGGEPLLNPDIFNWVSGISNLWPTSKIVIITNGTQLDRYDNLYDELLKYNGRVYLEVNHHTPKLLKSKIEEIKSFLKGPLTYEILTREHGWIPTDHIHVSDNTRITDINGIQIQFNPAWTFKESTLRYDNITNSVSLHDSNSELAFAICDFKKCHHFIKGKLYKCGPIGLLPDFINQFKIDLTDKQHSLIYNYKPAEPDWNAEQLDSFIDNLVNAQSIPQCSLCPQKQIIKPFSAVGKKTIRLQEIT